MQKQKQKPNIYKSGVLPREVACIYHEKSAKSSYLKLL